MTNTKPTQMPLEIWIEDGSFRRDYSSSPLPTAHEVEFQGGVKYTRADSIPAQSQDMPEAYDPEKHCLVCREYYGRLVEALSRIEYMAGSALGVKITDTTKGEK